MYKYIYPNMHVCTYVRYVGVYILGEEKSQTLGMKVGLLTSPSK